MGSAALLGARVAALAAMGLWLGDAVVLWPERTAVGAARWLTGLGAALLVSVSTALVVGAVLGPLLSPMVRDASQRVRALRARVRDADRDTQHDLGARLLAVGAFTGMVSLGANRVSFIVVMDLARPESMAMVLAATHVAFTVAVLLLWPWVVQVMAWLVRGASRVPVLRCLVDRALRVAGLVAGVATVVGVVMVTARWRDVRQLPWRTLLPAPGLLLGLWASTRVERAAGRTPGRVAWALVALALAAGTVAGLQLRPEATTARQIAFDRTLSGTLGHAAWTAALDVDRDGQLGVLGGGDCGPMDPRRYTGAVDVPGDGIDQDCDGLDAPVEPVRRRGRVTLPVEAVPARPTVVLVTVDGLAARRLQANGAVESVMPHLDRLAGASAVFVNCFSEGPSTRLSFPSMFTSRWDSELSFNFAPRPPYPLAASERQIQDMLDNAGYETVAVVSHPYFAPGAWPSVTRGFQRVDTTALAAGKNNAVQVTDAAIRALTSPRDRPLYLWVHYYDAHAPYVAPPGFTPADGSDSAVYDAELRFIDQELGRLIDAVLARPEPTYFMVTADHGTVFHPRPWTRHGRYGYDLYTATLHVPLIVHGPGIAARHAEGLASTMDLAPTVGDLVRAGDHLDFHGVSLVPELLNGADDNTRATFHEYYLGERDYRGEDPLVMVSMRTGRWNLVLDRTRGVYELYDWTRDYFESHDLYESSARVPKVMRFRSLLGSFLQQYHRRPTGAALLPPPTAHAE